MEGEMTADGPGGNAKIASAAEGHYRHRLGLDPWPARDKGDRGLQRRQQQEQQQT